MEGLNKQNWYENGEHWYWDLVFTEANCSILYQSKSAEYYMATSVLVDSYCPLAVIYTKWWKQLERDFQVNIIYLII